MTTVLIRNSAMSEDTTAPRYRIEHRQTGLSPLILACDDSLGEAHLVVAQWQQRLNRFGSSGVIALIDQETEGVVERASIISASASSGGLTPPPLKAHKLRR